MQPDQAALESDTDLIQVGEDLDHPTDRGRVDGVIVAERPNVVVPGQPDPEPQPGRRAQRG